MAQSRGGSPLLRLEPTPQQSVLNPPPGTNSATGFLSLEHGTTFETALWLKVEVEAASKAGTDPTAERFEPAAGNEQYPQHFSSF